MNCVHRITIFFTAIAGVVLPAIKPARAAEGWEPAGLAFDRQGNLFVADHSAGEILKFTADGTKTVFATAIKSPYGLAFDADENLYVSHPSIRK